MTKTTTRRLSSGNPDLRRHKQVPAPEIEESQTRLCELLTPATFAPVRAKMKAAGLRERVLTLPAMTAFVLSLVYRQIPSLSELLRVLALEGLLWTGPMRVSKQALSKRLQRLPASLFADLFEAVLARLRSRPRPSEPVFGAWQRRVLKRFSAVWIADGSTLEALRRRLGNAKGEAAKGEAAASCVLAGKLMMLVEAFTSHPVQGFYEKDPLCNDKTFTRQLLERLPKGGLMVFDMGFFSFPFFDAFTDEKKYFLTRLRQKTAFRSVRVLAEGPRYRDEVIEMGLYRSNPCEHRVRLISVRWGQTWYRYITNVLNVEKLPAQEAACLYRSRWRIEDAFLLTKRLLGLSQWWIGGDNGVQIQVYATWLFYAVLIDLRAEVAQALGRPLGRISVEMIFRGFYHFSRAEARGEADDVVSFLVEHHKLLGIVKARRKRHRKMDQRNIEIWGSLLS